LQKHNKETESNKYHNRYLKHDDHVLTDSQTDFNSKLIVVQNVECLWCISLSVLTSGESNDNDRLHTHRVYRLPCPSQANSGILFAALQLTRTSIENWTDGRIHVSTRRADIFFLS